MGETTATKGVGQNTGGTQILGTQDVQVPKQGHPKPHYSLRHPLCFPDSPVLLLRQGLANGERLNRTHGDNWFL